MKTTPYFEASHLAAASIDNPGSSEPTRIVDRQLLRLWQYRRMLRSPLIQPFRQALRPLVRWLFTNHLFIRHGTATHSGPAASRHGAWDDWTGIHRRTNGCR